MAYILQDPIPFPIDGLNPDSADDVPNIMTVATNFAPFFVFSQDERFYPCPPDTFMQWCGIGNAVGGTIKEPDFWKPIVSAGAITNRNIVGLDDGPPELRPQISSFTDPNTGLPVLYQAPTNGNAYCLLLHPPEIEDSRQRKIVQLARMAGNLSNPDFDPQNNQTYYHRQMYGCPQAWQSPSNELGNDCASLSAEILEANRQIQWEPTKQITRMYQKQILDKDENVVWVTDFVYVNYLVVNGSISVVPFMGVHFIDIETNAVRFLSSELQRWSTNPYRDTWLPTPYAYFMSTHGGSAWFEPKDVTARVLNVRDNDRSYDYGYPTHV